MRLLLLVIRNPHFVGKIALLALRVFVGTRPVQTGMEFAWCGKVGEFASRDAAISAVAT